MPVKHSVAIAATLVLASFLHADTPVIRSAKSGPWSATATWAGGKIPGADARVLIREGHRVVYDVEADHTVRGVNVAGTLAFAADKNTRLNVGLIKIQTGDEYSEEGFECDAHVSKPDASKPKPTLEVGTPDAPVTKRAIIRLVYVPGMNKESCPAIVCCGGRMDYHGTPLNRAWVKLGANAKSGDRTVSLAEPVHGWKVGDRVVLPTTHRYEYRGSRSTEERTIAALDGSQITLDEALKHDHLGSGDFRGEVANLSRTVVVESADPNGERGHTMYHRHSAGSISYAEFRHLGKPGVLGRYALHYHLCGNTMRGSSVVGASIHDSGNRWLTIHGTNYLVVRDNIGYGCLGHGFFLEDGTEVFNVLDRNLAVGAKRTKKLPKQALPFDQNNGAGFWWANSLNTFTSNVAVECGQYGFRYEATPTSAFKLTLPVQQADGTRKALDIRTLPFVRFDGNEVHSTTGLYGVNLGEGVNRVGPDAKHPFVVRDLKIWNTHYGFRPQVPSLFVENLRLHRTHYGVYHPHYANHVYRNVAISESNTEPFNRGHDDDSVQYGGLTVDGLSFDTCRNNTLIQISDTNATGEGVSHFRNVKTVNWTGTKGKALINRGMGPRRTPKSEKGVPIYVHDWFGPGRHAMVVSTVSGDYKAEPSRYRSEPTLTGDESRVAEVKDVAFPSLLTMLDDLPPTTVITRVQKQVSGKLLVRGTTADNGAVKRVVVNGVGAKATRDNFAEWEITVDGAQTIEAFAEDAAGNVEKLGHRVAVQ